MTRSAYMTDPALYDRVYAGFVADIAFHLGEARAAGGRVLEVCCGNGRVLVPLRAAGVDIEGLDFDLAMLEDGRRKLAERGLDARLHDGDMRTFELPERYALIYIPFNSFLHNESQDDQLATLRRCYQHLAPGGQLTVIAYHPNMAMVLGFDGSERLWKELPEPGGRTLRVYNAMRVDRVEQVTSVDRRVDEVDATGNVTATHRYSFRMRYVWRPEMQLLMRAAGFTRFDALSPFDAYDGPTFDPPRPPQDGGVVAYRAWKDA